MATGVTAGSVSQRTREFRRIGNWEIGEYARVNEGVRVVLSGQRERMSTRNYSFFCDLTCNYSRMGKTARVRWGPWDLVRS
jgi:hypothetical protein